MRYKYYLKTEILYLHRLIYVNFYTHLFVQLYIMKRSYIISFLLSFLLFWVICYFFNTVALLGRVVLAKAFISPWLTYTTVMKYMSMGMGVAPWMAYTLSALLLAFLWGSLYLFVYSLLLAIKAKQTRR